MIDILVWYVWVQFFAIIGWLIASSWLTRLPDRGYGIGKALGVFLGGYIYWIAISLGIAQNEPGAVLLALAICALIWLILKQHWRFQNTTVVPKPSPWPSLSVILWVEVIFALSFVLCSIYRAYNPDILEAGGEKFMESMYINAILRSPTFPPNDAWLSGFPISYYYFGYVILAMFTKVSGIVPSVAFNLGGAMFFALTAVSAFSLGYNLWTFYRLTPTPGINTVQDTSVHSKRKAPTAAFAAGLLTLTMVCLMGNLGGFMESLRCTNTIPQSFWVWLDVRHLDSKPVECNGLMPTRFYWWWDWSRVIHDYTPTGADQEVISEFPIFSTVLGDNHPHVMNLPFVILALTLAVHFLSADTKGDRPEQQGTPASELNMIRNTIRFTLDGLPVREWFVKHNSDIVLGAIVLGGLSFMNTWDFPVYGTVVAGAILMKRWHYHESLLPGIFLGVVPMLLGYVFYLPFYITFASQARGISINLFNGTRFVQYFIMFAPFLLVMVAFLWYFIRKNMTSRRVVVLQSVFVAAAILVLAAIGTALIGLLSSQSREYLNEIFSTGSVAGVSKDTVLRLLNGRVSDPWVPVFLTLSAALCIIVILTRSSVDNQRSTRKIFELFALMLFLFGAILTSSVEFVFLQDLFGTRMNTVFKFYYQTWTIWAIASAFGIMILASNGALLGKLASSAAGILMLAGLLFPIYAIPSKAGSFNQTPTLDGSAYLSRTRPDDARMIQWLNTYVKGAPVIAEAPADHYAAYTYSGRISAFTGLPTLLGWGGHEHQWRGNYDEPSLREPQIETLYNSTDLGQVQEILKQYHVQYVIVGEQERSRYTEQGLTKFASICNLEFQSGNSSIYRCG